MADDVPDGTATRVRTGSGLTSGGRVASSASPAMLTSPRRSRRGVWTLVAAALVAAGVAADDAHRIAAAGGGHNVWHGGWRVPVIWHRRGLSPPPQPGPTPPPPPPRPQPSPMKRPLPPPPPPP